MGISGFATILLQDLNLFPFLRRRVRLEDLDGVEEVRIEVRSLARSPVPTWEWSLCHGLEHLKGRDDFDGKTLKSYVKAAILINMNTPTGLADVVKLTVKCFPGYHMNYNVNMSNAKDLSFVGGELGGSSGPKESQAFLQVGQGMIQMRSDSRFQYHQTWEELGGSASAALYLQDQDDSAEGFNLLTTPCTEADQQKATEICRKAGLKNEASLSFAECVFDVCRAGGDALPELTELSWHEDD